MSVKDFVGDKDFDIGTVDGEDMKIKKNSSVEVLREQITGCELMKGSKLYDAHTKALHKAYLDALLALEKLGRLDKWLDEKYAENWFVLTNNKDLEEARIIRNFIKEVRGFLNE